MKILAEIEETAKMDSLPSIGPIKGKIVEGVIKEHKPKKVLEIGTLHGYSPILIANTVSNFSYGSKDLDTDTQYNKPMVISVEKDEKRANIARKNVKNSVFAK